MARTLEFKIMIQQDLIFHLSILVTTVNISLLTNSYLSPTASWPTGSLHAVVAGVTAKGETFRQPEGAMLALFCHDNPSRIINKIMTTATASR